jgi:hypothetical protein
MAHFLTLMYVLCIVFCGFLPLLSNSVGQSQVFICWLSYACTPICMYHMWKGRFVERVANLVPTAALSSFMTHALSRYTHSRGLCKDTDTECHSLSHGTATWPRIQQQLPHGKHQFKTGTAPLDSIGCFNDATFAIIGMKVQY